MLQVVQSAFGPELSREFFNGRRPKWMRYCNQVTPCKVEGYYAVRNLSDSSDKTA